MHQQLKIRINDLARELEVKSKVILDILGKVGVTEKKTHSSSIEVDEAEKVKQYYQQHGEPGTTRSSRSMASVDEFKPKIDLSHISKPGDVLKAITQKAQPQCLRVRPPRCSAAAAANRGCARCGCSQTGCVRGPPGRECRAGCSRRAQAGSAIHHPQSVARPPAAIFIPPKATPPAAPVPAAAVKPSEPVIEDQIAATEVDVAAEIPTTPEAAQLSAQTPSAPVAAAPPAPMVPPLATRVPPPTVRPGSVMSPDQVTPRPSAPPTVGPASRLAAHSAV